MSKSKTQQNVDHTTDFNKLLRLLITTDQAHK